MQIPQKFQALVDKSAYAAVARLGVVRLFKTGAVLMSEGDSGRSIFVLLSGSVVVYSSDELGRQIIHGENEAECLLGEMSLGGETRSATVQVTRDAVCAIIQIAQLVAQLQTDPDLAMRLIMLLISRSRRATDIGRQLALDSVYRRVARLLQTADRLPGKVHDTSSQSGLRIELSQQEIASRVGASRDMVSKIFKTLLAGGYLKKDGRDFYLARSLPRDW